MMLLISTAVAYGWTHISVATDLAPWFNGGHSLIAMFEHDRLLPKWRIGIESWSMTLPQFIVEARSENQGEGWKRHIDRGLAISIDRHRNWGNGWHYGGILNLMDSTVSREAHSGEGQFRTLEILGKFGYRWFPKKNLGFFVNPWAAAGPMLAISTPREVGGETYIENSIQYLATVHIGWKL